MREEQFGRYVLLERLGYGGMAEVFVARTESIGGFEKLLAIKRLLPFCTEDEQTVELLADEAKITVRLTHPNIVQVFDFGRVNQSYYIAMEFVDGLDLKSLVQIDELSSEPLPIDVALFTAISILDALDFAHNRADEHGEPLGIIHRDVSPHNVLISRHGQVKLTDFGVARARISSHVSIVGDIRGKFSYMPPEQACGGEIDQRVDVFAGGAILYELLAGKQPYRSASSGEQMALLNQKLVPPSALVDDIPPELDAITVKALEKDPARRFDSAKTFANALRDQLERYYPSDPLGPQQALARLVERRLNEEQHIEASEPEGPKMTLADFSAREDSVIWGQAHIAQAIASTDEVPHQQPGRATLELPPLAGDIINSASRDGPTLNEIDDGRLVSARAPAMVDDPAFMKTQLAIPAPRDRDHRGVDEHVDPADASTDMDIAPIKKAPTMLDPRDDQTLVQLLRHETDPDGVQSAVRVSEGVALVAAETALEMSPPTHDTLDEHSAPRLAAVAAGVAAAAAGDAQDRRDGPRRVPLPIDTDADAIIDRPPRDDSLRGYDGARGDALSRARHEISEQLERERSDARRERERERERSAPRNAASGAAPGNGLNARPRSHVIDKLTDPEMPAIGGATAPPAPGISSRYVTIGVLITVGLVGVILAVWLATSGTSNKAKKGSGSGGSGAAIASGVGTAGQPSLAGAVEAGAPARVDASAGTAARGRADASAAAAAPRRADAAATSARRKNRPPAKKDGTVIRIIKLPVRNAKPRRGHGRHGYLTVNAFPWGRVEVDGKKTDRVTPMQRYRLRAGRHRVRVYYVETKRYSRWRRVRVRAGHEKKVIFRER